LTEDSSEGKEALFGTAMAYFMALWDTTKLSVCVTGRIRMLETPTM
jgi:hypothetical protein